MIIPRSFEMFMFLNRKQPRCWGWLEGGVMEGDDAQRRRAGRLLSKVLISMSRVDVQPRASDRRYNQIIRPLV